MTQVGYRAIGARLRPPRLLVGYRLGEDWIYAARRVVASISRVWGGNGTILAPVGESGAMNRCLAPFMRAYDPDHIGIHVQILADLAHTDPAVINKVVAQRPPAQDPDAFWREVSETPVRDRDWTRLAEQADAYCSPFKGLDQDAQRFQQREIIWLHRAEPSRRTLATVSEMPGGRTYTLDLSRTDPAIALMVETRVGSLDLGGREGRNVIELPVQDEDLSDLLQLSIAGMVQPHAWDLQARYVSAVETFRGSDPDLTVDQFLAASPFACSGQFTSKLRSAIPEPPVVCVIGETADDHALALLCDRLFHHAAWVPTHLLSKDMPLATAVKVALHQLRYVTEAPERPVLVTSISEPSSIVESLTTDLNSMFGVYTEDWEPLTDPQRFEFITPAALAAERGRSMLADSGAFSLSRYVPVAEDSGDVSLLAPVSLPLPQAAENLGPDLNWYVDTWMPEHHLPPRTSLSSGLLQRLPAGFPEAIVRASRDGLTFASPNFGFVMAGGPPEARLAQPLLRFPSAGVVFTELAAASGAHAERSPAGRRSAIAVEMWGSFKAVAADLTGPVRGLLDAFIPPPGADGNYEIGYEIRGDGYVALEDVAEILSVSQHEARNTIDRLLALNVLRQGFLLYCARCRSYAFYRIDQVGPTFECHSCGHASPLSHGQWYAHDAEPHWYYSLDQVIRDLLTHHGDVPLLAAADLSHQAFSALWSPELMVTNDSSCVELDMCLVIDGRIVVGEAKSNRTLSGNKGTQEAARRLVHAAQLLSADEIVLATSQSSWAKDALSAVENAVSESWTRGPRPLIQERTRVGT
jgi:hypothetical protein